MALLITGGTGFVGRQFIAQSGADTILAVSRNPEAAAKTLGENVEQVIRWDPLAEPLALPPVAGLNQVVNLMGESVAQGRWTKAKKQRIRDSRVLGTRRLVDALLAGGNPPDVFVSASAVGIYGNAKETVVDENYPAASNFKATVCEDWEQEALRLTEHGTRVVCLRIGIVLGDGGGALEKMLPIFRWGLGGRLGSGKQWMPWIHLTDLVRMIQWALDDKSVQGVLNATSPNPVRNSEFTRQLALAVKRPAFLPAPKLALRLVLGEFAKSLLYSQRVVPTAALQAGFDFQFPDLQTALAAAIGDA